MKILEFVNESFSTETSQGIHNTKLFEMFMLLP